MGRHNENIIGNKYTNEKQELEYEVIEFVEKSGVHERYKIRFIRSGYETVSDKYRITHGNIVDKTEFIPKTGKPKGFPYDIIGNEYVSKNQKLKYIVIDVTRRDDDGHWLYKIRFLESNNEKEYDRYRVINRLVSDNMSARCSNISTNIVGKTFVNNRGLEFIVTDKYTVQTNSTIATKYTVKFLKSGYIKKNCNCSEIKSGMVKDPYTFTKVYKDLNNQRYTITEIDDENNINKKCKVYYIESRKFYEVNYYLAIKGNIRENN